MKPVYHIVTFLQDNKKTSKKVHFFTFIHDKWDIMLRSYNLLENVLIDIEKGIREGVSVITLTEKYAFSEGHLRRLFRAAFKQSLGEYIRSRKLTASLDDLLKTDANLLNIALDYGFDYEQSYIRAFKREFGITPGDIRKSGHTVKAKLPLYLLNKNKYPHGLFLVYFLGRTSE